MAIDIGPKIGIDGEREFRQAIQNINQQVKTLSSEMTAAASAFSRSDDAEKKNTETKKLLEKQIEAQKKKLELLREGLEKSSKKYGENDTRTLKWRQSVADATTALSKMEGQLDDVSAEVDNTGDSMAEAESKTSSFGETAKAVFTGQALLDGVKALGRGIKTVIDSSAAAITGTAELGDHIDKQSQKLGISRTKYQQLSYALDKYGADVDALQGSLINMATQAQQGAEAFTQLGLSQDFVKSASTEALFEAVIGKLQGMAEGTKRTALANTLLGETAAELAPLLNDTAQGFDALKRQAPLLSDATVDAAAAMQDSMSAFNSTMTEIKADVAGQVMPAITKALDTARKKLQTGEARKEINKAGEALGDVAATVVEMGAKALPKLASLVSSLVTDWKSWALAIGGVVVAFKGFSIVRTLPSTINGAKAAFAGLNATMAANPIGAVVSAIGLLIGVVSAFVIASDDASESASKLSEEERAIADAADEAREAYSTAIEEYANATAVIDGNAQKTRDLWGELQMLAGESGHVNEKDRARAEYILGELSDALGTEYTLTGNQITQYQELKGSIEDLIKAKQANALLDQAQVAYNAALEGRIALEDEMLLKQGDLETAQNNYSKALKDHEQDLEAYARSMGKTKEEVRTFRDSYTGWTKKDDFGKEVGAEKGYLDAIKEAERAYDASTEALGKNLNTISLYNKAQEEIAKGNYEGAIRNLDAINGAHWDAYDSYTDLSEKETEKLESDMVRQNNIIKAHRRARNRDIAGFGKEELKQEERRLDEMQRLYDNQSSVWIRKGADIARNISDGFGRQSNVAQRKAEKIVGGLIAAVDGAAEGAGNAGANVAIEFGDGISAWSNRAIENSESMATGVTDRLNAAEWESQRLGARVAAGYAVGIESNAGSAQERAKETAAGVVSGLDVHDKAYEMGANIVVGLADGIESKWYYARKKTDELIYNHVLGPIQSAAEIHSPSRVTFRDGVFIVQGLINGIESAKARAVRSARGLTADILGSMNALSGTAMRLATAGIPSGAAGAGYRTDIGGINITVNAPNVTSVEGLADLVSRKIYDAVINAQQARR